MVSDDGRTMYQGSPISFIAAKHAKGSLGGGSFSLPRITG